LILNVPPKVDAWLDEQARRADMEKNDLALKVLNEAAGAAQPTAGATTPKGGTGKILRAFEQWCLTRPIRTGFPLDDSLGCWQPFANVRNLRTLNCRVVLDPGSGAGL
jgi:hypothetical protein